MAFNAEHIKWFRDSSPYIDAHRDSTFVVCLANAALASDNLANIISDLALLNSLGVRLVITFGSNKIAEDTEPGKSIVDESLLNEVKAELGAFTTQLSAKFSYSVPNSPGRRREVTTASGNFIKARPVGVLDGIDHLQSGEVRSVNKEAIQHLLDGNTIVMLPSVGFSPSGEVFYLSPEAVAREAACALGADKLIFMTRQAGLNDEDGNLLSEIDLSNYDASFMAHDPNGSRLLQHCDHACQHQVRRCHIVSFDVDGAILEELFTRDGCGTQIVGHSYEQIRQATTEDVPGILRLIDPLEKSGVLVKRSRELIESEIDQFYVIERDGLLICCAALYPFQETGELACLVTHPDYRNGDRGDRLLDKVEQACKAINIKSLFVLTTQSEHWFQDRGFVTSSIEDLPEDRKRFYNYQRGSKVLIKPI